MSSLIKSKCVLFGLFGLAAAGGVSGCVEQPEVGLTSQAEAGNVCAFVVATVGGQTITTPSIAVIVPDTGAAIDPIRVHLDETNQSIVGYSLRTPGVDHEIAGQNLFVPGPVANVPSFTQTLPAVGGAVQYCLAAGVSTPAVPIHIPASLLEIPGASTDVPATTVTYLGKQTTIPGRTLFLPGRTIILPGADAAVPPITVETAQKSVAVTFDATYQPPSPLPPAIILAPSL
ncbi:MAG TPA: hypothetical protein VNO30_35440 [Kofleriaceae bacterium]|nr:hypothetical protein [Kofleriaceae bacterium]